jgi:hydroxypyruvate isomerase
MNLKIMPLKFCANLTFLYPEIGNILGRYDAARKAGFRAVECAWLYDHPLEDVVKAKQSAQVQQILINTEPGSSLGYAALAGQRKQFEDSLELTIKYAKALDCKRIHIMSGKDKRHISEPAVFAVMEENLRHAAIRLQQEGILGVIEPINKFDVPDYILNDFDKAVELVKKINSPHLKLQLDIYHLQIISGNLSRRIQEYFPHIGHIQVAQVPRRGHPASDGEINYKYIFRLLEELGYDGWIGLEYKPQGDTNSEFKWIKEMGYCL